MRGQSLISVIQKEGERINNYVSELKRLLLTSAFGDLQDSLVRE